MSSNFVPQHLPASSMELGQLEPILKNGGSPTPEIQMGGIGTVSSGPGSQQFLVSNSQMEMIPNYTDSQGLSAAYMQMGHLANINGNLGAQKLFTPSNQFGGMGALPTNVGSYQSLASMKRKAPLEPMFVDPGTHQLLMPNKRVAQLEHRPWLQQVAAANKRTVQLEPMASAPMSQNMPGPNKKMGKIDSFSGRSGPQRSSSQKNQSSQIQPSPKGQQESFESVRSKMRETLSAALALVNQQQDKSLESENKSQGNTHESPGPVKQEYKEEPKENLPSSETCSSPKSSIVENTGQNVLSNGNTSESTLTSLCDGKDFQSSNILPFDVAFGDNLFVKDELLQGNGLSWVLESDIEMSDRNENFPPVKQDSDQEMRQPEEQAVQSIQQVATQSPEQLAFEIEAQLFKLFGGVNKKYKEKGRSLLFNLKDRNNPELRERVMSGEITPERLCSMTAEELASKELSEWRMAKAEELAQMVVLPDSELDVRRLVKKTHKGEVEVEQFDDIPMEVPISHDQGQPRSKETEVSNPLKSVKPRNESKARRQNSNVDESFTFPSNDGSDLLQGLMVDDGLKDLPPIVSLDEFMESLDNEPPFEIPAEKGTPASEKEDSETSSHMKASGLSPKDSVHSSGLSPKDSVHSSPAKGDEIDATDSKPVAVIKSEDSPLTKSEGSPLIKSEDKPAVIKSEDSSSVRKTSDIAAVKSGDTSADLKSSGGIGKTEPTAVQKPKGEHLWGGSLQLSMSTKAPVIGIFKCGEKTSAKEWAGSVEIKGRVKLDAFKEFLEELPQSRSRAVMAVHFVSKEGSSETEIARLREVGDSYVSDERVGFAEPCSGVELYLCPPHNKTCAILGKILKEHVEALNTIDNGLIGVVVWRRLTSPKSSSHQKHASKKQHYSSSSSRRHHDTNSNANYNSKPSQPRVVPPSRSNVTLDDEEDEVPPGFGPPASRDDDDLPEFNYSSASNPTVPQFSTQRPSRVPELYPESASRPVDKMRELVLKYGQNDSRAWNNDDDDDDIPEWQPTAPPTQYQRPQQQTVNSYQQPILRPYGGSPLQQQQPLQSFQPQVHVASGLPTSNPYWQPGNQWAPPPPPPPTGGVWPSNVAFQPESGQYYGEPDRGTASQPGLAWRQNAPRSRGF